jgi:hypothetical protein
MLPACLPAGFVHFLLDVSAAAGEIPADQSEPDGDDDAGTNNAKLYGTMKPSSLRDDGFPQEETPSRGATKVPVYKVLATNTI